MRYNHTIFHLSDQLLLFRFNLQFLPNFNVISTPYSFQLNLILDFIFDSRPTDYDESDFGVTEWKYLVVIEWVNLKRDILLIAFRKQSYLGNRFHVMPTFEEQVFSNFDGIVRHLVGYCIRGNEHTVFGDEGCI